MKYPEFDESEASSWLGLLALFLWRSFTFVPVYDASWDQVGELVLTGEKFWLHERVVWFDAYSRRWRKLINICEKENNFGRETDFLPKACWRIRYLSRKIFTSGSRILNIPRILWSSNQWQKPTFDNIIVFIIFIFIEIVIIITWPTKVWATGMDKGSLGGFAFP